MELSEEEDDNEDNKINTEQNDEKMKQLCRNNTEDQHKLENW